MYRIKCYIEEIGEDRKINNELRVEGGQIYLDINTHFKYKEGNWWQLCDNIWVNLQGGVPDYQQETNIDENLFEEI